MIQVFVKRDFLLDGVRPVPILMHISPNDEQADLEYWNTLRQSLEDTVQVSYFDQLEEAGKIIVIPHNIKEYRKRKMLKEVLRFCHAGISQGKLVIGHSLESQQTSSKNFSVQFRTNNVRDTDNTITIPNWLYDLGHRPVYPIKDKPTVSFTGNVEYPNRLNKVAKHIPLPNQLLNYLACSSYVDRNLSMLTARQVVGRYVRQALLGQLQAFANVDVRILSRTEGFFSLSSAQKETMQSEYRASIANNLYTIVIRGDGQGFFQLYEVMSAGRIPIIIDTRAALPKLTHYRWEDFTLRVPFRKLAKLEQYILEYHHSHTEQELADKCSTARLAYEELLPHTFVPEVMIPKIIHHSDEKEN